MIRHMPSSRWKELSVNGSNEEVFKRFEKKVELMGLKGWKKR